MKTLIHEDEWYPVYSIITDERRSCKAVDMPSNIRNKCIKAESEFLKCQEILRQFRNGERTK